MKYKVGDKVRIVSREHGHGFNLGDVVEILKMWESDYVYRATKNGELWFVTDEEVEPVDEET